MPTIIDYNKEMFIVFSQYAKVINNICLCYSGSIPDYAIQLDHAVDIIQKSYPDLKITLCLYVELLPLVKNQAFPFEELKDRRSDFVYVKEFTVNPDWLKSSTNHWHQTIQEWISV